MYLKEVFDKKDELLDKEIKVNGWIRNHRPQKEFGFIDFSDGTCFKHLQIVYDNTLSNFNGNYYAVNLKQDSIDSEDPDEVEEQERTQLSNYIKKSSIVDVKGEKLVNLDYGTGFDVTGINPENYPNKTDLIEKISQEGFTLEQVLGNYHLDEEDTKKIVRVGDCLLIESGKEEYVMEMEVRQYYDHRGKYINESIGLHKYTISIKEDEKGKPIVFKPGYTYNILLKIYGIENIEVSTEVSDWQNGGGSIGWDPDEF